MTCAAPAPTEDPRASVIAAVLDRLAEGESLSAICRDPAMPHRATLHRWLQQSPDLQARYAEATDIRAEAIADEILEIADDARNDWMTRTNGDGSEARVLDAEHVQRSRLRIDARKWLLAKMAPKKYGDRIQQEVSGPDGAPVEVNVVTDLDRAKALAAMIARTRAEHGARSA